jgi:hypothetical protein
MCFYKASEFGDAVLEFFVFQDSELAKQPQKNVRNGTNNNRSRNARSFISTGRLSLSVLSLGSIRGVCYTVETEISACFLLVRRDICAWAEIWVAFS